jgi:crotonobetainyl-CoA:carnitine CoA-transferase CaiB-like acyl-CoA transferase
MRIVELAQNLAGPYCGRILSDLGAEVVKIEPLGGDAARFWGPPHYAGEGTLFAAANAGKRSLALDLRSPVAFGVLERLLEGADVLLQALRPGALAAMGLDWEALKGRYPKLVFASVLAYGEEGPLADLPGYEPLMQAHAGIMSYTGEADGPPVRVGTSVVDLGTGMWTAVAVLAALRERDRTGEGSRVSGALFDTALAWSGYHLLAALDGTVAGRSGTGLPMICPYGVFETRDGALMVAVGNDAIFRRFCPVLGLDDLSADPELATNAGRVAQRARVEKRTVEAMAAHGEAELLARFREAGVPAAPIRDMAGVLADPQTQASGMLTAVAHPTRADYRTPALPIRWGGARPDPGGAPPPVGGGGREVLATAGYSDAEIEALLAAGTVFGTD